MKKLFLLLLLACNANAETWYEMPNSAGGKILLLSGNCSGKTGKIVIATTPQGTNVNGCWYFFADMVHIVWENGKTSSFNPTDFTQRKKDD